MGFYYVVSRMSQIMRDVLVCMHNFHGEVHRTIHKHDTHQTSTLNVVIRQALTRPAITGRLNLERMAWCVRQLYTGALLEELHH